MTHTETLNVEVPSEITSKAQQQKNLSTDPATVKTEAQNYEDGASQAINMEELTLIHNAATKSE